MKFNKLTILKLIPLVLLLIVLIVDPSVIIKSLNCFIVHINDIIVNKGIVSLLYYVVIIGVVLLIFRRVIRRSWERFKVKYMTPISTYSKGKAVWSVKRDKMKDYIRVEYDNSYTSGFIVNRVCEVYVFGIHLFDLDFYKILSKYQKRSMN